MLNKQKGNMYNWISHTWNPIKGKCPHNCSYCYMKVFPQRELRLTEKDLNNDLGKGNFIFVGSSTDMFAKAVPREWILKVLKHCKDYPENTYLFQSKNPERFEVFREELILLNCVLGTTMETDRYPLLNKFSNSIGIIEKSIAMKNMRGFRKMITIEPIMDFDLSPFVSEIKIVNPEWVNIGADSKGHNLPEPSPYKIELLIKELKKFTRVKLKDNLGRLNKK